MNEQLAFGILLHLRDIVGDIVHEPHAQRLGWPREYRLEGPPHLMSNDLPIGKRRVGGAIHGGEIVLPLRRAKWSTG